MSACEQEAAPEARVRAGPDMTDTKKKYYVRFSVAGASKLPGARDRQPLPRGIEVEEKSF